MRFKLGVLTAALLSTGILHADTITVNLGTSNQNYTLTGTGGSNGFGTYLAQQGDCFAGSAVTTCILTGSYTGTTPGYDAGTYTLTTTYDNTDGGLAATSTEKVVPPNQGNYFNFNPFSSDVNMALLLIQSAGGVNAIPIVQDGTFVADSYFIGGTAPTCGNLPAGVDCTQGNVGLYSGDTFSGPITGGVIFNTDPTSSLAAVPEPEWLTLGGLLPGALVFARRRFLQTA
jgi:hypothetical protein